MAIYISRLVLLTCLFLAGLAFGTQSAFAHAVMLESTPAIDAVLDDSPLEIRFGFNENVGPIFVKVLDATGAEVGDPEEFRVEGNNVYLPLGATLGNGTYVAVYRVISADTHPVGGSVLFAVGEPISDVSSVAEAGNVVSGWRLPVAVNRFLLYISGALAAGSALLLLLMNMPSSLLGAIQNQGRISAILFGITLVLAIGLGGAEMQAGGVGALFASSVWATGLGSTLGSSAMIGLPGCIMLWLTFRKATPATGLLWVGALLTLGSFLVTGHAATAPPAWLMALVVGIHLSAVAFWFAALWPLKKAVSSLPAVEAGGLLEHFSGRAILAVSLLVLSGVAISWVQVESLEGLISTDYGIRLLVKIGLVLLVIGLAALNKQRLTGKLQSNEAGAAVALARSIRSEYVLMLLIVAMAVSLTLPSPPRALAAVGASSAMATSGFNAESSKDGLSVKVEVSPGRTGENMIMLQFTDANGATQPLQSVRLTLSLPAASLEGSEHEVEAMMPGMYHFMLNELIIPGEWELRIDAFVDDYDKKVLRVTVPIK